MELVTFTFLVVWQISFPKKTTNNSKIPNSQQNDLVADCQHGEDEP